MATHACGHAQFGRRAILPQVVAAAFSENEKHPFRYPASLAVSRSSRNVRRDAVDVSALTDERRLVRTAKSCGASAADLKFLQRSPRVHPGTSNRKRHWNYLSFANALGFPKFAKRVLRWRANFERWALAAPMQAPSWRQCIRIAQAIEPTPV
jgi:hypothetical protein